MEILYKRCLLFRDGREIVDNDEIVKIQYNHSIFHYDGVYTNQCERVFQRYILGNIGWHYMEKYDIVKVAREKIKKHFRFNEEENRCGSVPDGISLDGLSTCEIKHSKKNIIDIVALLEDNNYQICRNAMATPERVCYIFPFYENILDHGIMECYMIKILSGGELLYTNKCWGLTKKNERCKKPVGDGKDFCHFHQC